MDSDKVKFIKETSIKLLAARLIEDRIAWHKDSDYAFNNDDELVENSIETAECLWDKLEEKGYVESEQENKIPPLEEGIDIDPSWTDGFKGCI